MRTRAFGLALAIAAPAFGQFNLANYELTARYPLPAVAASEASAVTYNWDTGTLFVIGDEGEAIVEISRTGQHLSTMSLTGFDDTEGLTYTGNGQFVVAEERIQTVYELSYAAGGTVDRGGLRSAILGPSVGNIGLEGVSFDPRTGRFANVKEKTPQAVREATIDFATGTAANPDLFTPNLGVADLSDVQVLSLVSALDGTPDADNLLIYSQESARLMEVSRAGEILSDFDFSTLAGNAEGVTVDPDGVVYVVSETPEMFVLSPVPEPASLVLCAAGLMLLVRRRTH